MMAAQSHMEHLVYPLEDSWCRSLGEFLWFMLVYVYGRQLLATRVDVGLITHL